MKEAFVSFSDNPSCTYLLIWQPPTLGCHHHRHHIHLFTFSKSPLSSFPLHHHCHLPTHSCPVSSGAHWMPVLWRLDLRDARVRCLRDCQCFDFCSGNGNAALVRVGRGTVRLRVQTLLWRSSTCLLLAHVES